MHDDDLTRLLAEAKAQAPVPSPALMDRVLADALALQPVVAALPIPRPKPRIWRRVADAFGGMPAVAALGCATVVGMAVGYADPTTVDYLTGGLAFGETVDLFPTTAFLATEG